MRKSEIIFDAITNIREELVDRALDYRFRRRRVHWQRYLSAAACVALVVMVGLGAVRLGIIDGFGGGSKNAASNSAAPEAGDWNGSVSDDCMVEDTTDNAPEEPGEEPPADRPVEDYGSEKHTFRGKILEVGEGYLLVEPDEGSWIRASADLIRVPVEDTAGFQPDLAVTVTFCGDIQETYPAQITGVVSVTLSEKEN